MNGKNPTNGNALALVSDKDTLKGLLDSTGFKESMQAVATKYMTADRVTKVALLAASRQPKLFLCTAQSFLQSVIKGAELGLEFGGTTQQGFLVPYKNGFLSKKSGHDVYECQFIPGYRGFVELAYRSGNVTFIEVQLVYQNDAFDYGYNYGTGASPFLKHKPLLSGPRGGLVCGYSVIMLKDSPLPKIDFMTVDELEQIHQCSKSKDDGPWVTWPAEMQKKSVLRRSIKWIRTTPELAAAEEADSVDFDLGAGLTLDTDHQLGTEGVKARLAGKLGQTNPAKAAAEAIDSHFEGKDTDSPEDTESSRDSSQKKDREESGWMCPDGHAFATPKPDKSTMFGVCPECGSADIKQLA
jgi:recombination protein RecT